MAQRSYLLSFSGGEISPLMRSRIDDVTYRSGYAYGRNGVVRPTGAWQKRPGFSFVKSAKHADKVSRLTRFVYGTGDSYAMEWGENSLRFHNGGTTLKYATPIPIASVNLGTDTFTSTAAHGLAINEQVRITHKGTSIPGNLATGTIYYVRSVPTDTTFTLSASAGPGALLDLTTNSTIDETSFWKQSGQVGVAIPREYVTSRTATRNANNIDCSAAHGLVITHGDAVHFTTTTTLPPPLVVGTIYYSRYVDSDTFSVFPTKADALANTNQITLTGAGVGTHTFHYAYYKGDICWGGSLTILASTSSRAFWCTTDLPTALPTVSDWYQMPADGTYEIYHGMVEADLRAMTYSQSFDVWAWCVQGLRPYELRREFSGHPSGTSADSDVYKFTLDRAVLAESIDTPTGLAATTDYGDHQVGTIAAGAILFASTGATTPMVIPGDTVYIEEFIGTGLGVPGVNGTPGFAFVTEVTTGGANTFEMRLVDGGAIMSNVSGLTANWAMRVVGSSALTSEFYKVTAIGRNNEESAPTSALEVANFIGVPGASNTLTWNAVDGAVRYRVYRQVQDSLYGFIGETESGSFKDDNIIPDDLSLTPPIQDDEIAVTADDYPAAVGHFQQRRYYGGTTNGAQRVWASRLGTEGTFTSHRPIQPDDRLRFDVAAYERSLIRHFVPTAHLWCLTSSSEVRISGVNEDAITPGNESIRPVSQIGSSIVRPIVAASNVLFVGDRDGHVYELNPQQATVTPPDDLSARATHLFDEDKPVDSGQMKSPLPIEWYVTTDGLLLGMTYMPAQNIRAWHAHATSGYVESICTIPEDGEDRLYASIRRTINGSTVRYVERLGSFSTPADFEDWKLLDCAVTYDGAVIPTVTGATHLEGRTDVYALADGAVVGPFTVASGSFALPVAASVVTYGLRYSAVLRTLPPVLQIDGFGQGTEKNVREIAIRVVDSAQFKSRVYVEGYEAEFPATPAASPGLAIDELKSYAVVRCPVTGSWNQDAQVEISSENPVPLTIVSLTLNTQGGG